MPPPLRTLVLVLVGTTTTLSGLVLATTLLGFTPHPYFAALQALPIPIATATLGTAALALLTKNPHAPRVALAAALVWIAFVADTTLSSRWAATEHPASLVVAAANLRYNNHRADELTAEIALTASDVLITSETPTGVRAALRTELPRGWREAHTGAGELGAMVSIWTHLPVIQRSEWTIGSDRLPVVMLDTDPTPVLIVGVHLNSPVTRTDLAAWRRQLRDLAEMVCGQSVPVVVAGDFNASLTHPAIRPLTGCAADAAASQGVLWVRTWSPGVAASSKRVLGLDHVMVANAKVSSYDQFKIPGSDHDGVQAGVVIQPPPKPTPLASPTP